MNQFASDKKYLELAGLKALVIKIGALRAEYMGQNKEVNDVLADLTARLDAIVAPDGKDANILPVTDSYDYSEGTLFECVAKYIQDLRNELGATDAAGAETVYARLDQIENWVNNGFDVEGVDEEGNATTVHYDGLLDRVKKLEDESFAQVECSTAEEVKANNVWKAAFKNATGKVLGEIELNTSDFVVDGILDAVRLISVVEPGNKIVDLSNGGIEYDGATVGAEEPWHTLIAESQGKNAGDRYIVFSFKTVNQDAEDVVDPDKDPTTPTEKPLSNIWVSMHDLHDSFDFNSAVDEKSVAYVDLSVDTHHTTTGSTNVVYTVKLTDEVVTILDKLLGKVEGVRSYDEIDADLHAAEDNIANSQDDIKQLQDYVANGFEEQPGENGNSATEPETKKGLLERANDLEDTMGEVIGWINEDGIIPVKFVEDYFDYIVFGGGTAAATREAAYEAAKPIIDKEPAGKEPQFDANGQYEGAFNG